MVASTRPLGSFLCGAICATLLTANRPVRLRSVDAMRAWPVAAPAGGRRDTEVAKVGRAKTLAKIRPWKEAKEHTADAR